MTALAQPSRLQNDFKSLSRFGALPGGGVTRLAFSPEDLEARSWLKAAMKECGLAVRTDAAGNVFGRRKGQMDLAPVMIGSHIDTVPEGGHYDGVIGVLGALEVIRLLNDQRIETKRPVEVVNFAAEESSRFGMATLGSKALLGNLDAETLHRLRDADGISLYTALQQAGCSPDAIASARLHKSDLHAFVELHIEQGPVLESRQLEIGVVTSIAAPTRFHIEVRGRADHSGTTPMALRKDAQTAAAEVTLAVERIAGEQGGPCTVATVGFVRTEPGVMNVVPGRVEMGLDIRDIDRAAKQKVVSAILDEIRHIAKRRQLDIHWEMLCDDEPVPMSPRLISCLEKAAQHRRLPYQTMPSGAGHDTMNLACITEAALIFVPSAQGLSHNISEFTSMEAICSGTDLLFEAVCTLADEP